MVTDAVAKFVLLIMMFLTFVGCSSCVNSSYLFGPSNLFRDKRRSFIKIDAYKNILLSNTSSTSEEEYEIDLRTTASGAIIGHDRELTLVATSAHVCSIRTKSQINYFVPNYSNFDSSWILIEKSSFILNDYKGNTYRAIVLKQDHASDICILVTTSISLPKIKISRGKPLIGAKYYNIAAPMGVWDPKAIPLFEGFYLGAINTHHNSNLSYMFSIPATGGSSGSPIINSYGELMGVIHSSYRGFNHLSLATTNNQVCFLYRGAMRKLLKDYKQYKLIIDVANN